MNKEQAINLAKEIVNEKRKGSFIRATWHTEQKPAKEFKGKVSLSRKTSAVVRLGIDYSNLGRVKQGIESGERGEVGPLNGEWIFFPFVLKSSLDKTLFRIYQNETNKLSTEFFVNGERSDESEYVKYLTPSEKRALNERNSRVCFSVNIDGLEIE
jgi:hypothetical protein